MRQVVPLVLSGDGRILIEVDDDRGVVRAGTTPAQALARLTDVLENVRRAADDALSTMREMASEPTSIELKFGVTLTAEANAVITKVGTNANLTVTVTWERDPDGHS